MSKHLEIADPVGRRFLFATHTSIVAIVASIMTCLGCNGGGPNTSGSTATAAVTANSGAVTPDAASAASAAVPQGPPIREVWDACYFQGEKIGYIRTAYYHLHNDVGTLERVVAEGRMTLRRGGQTIEQRTQEITSQTEVGDVFQFDTSVQMGSSPMRTHGVVDGDKATLELTTDGRRTSQTIDWPARTVGPSGIIDELARVRIKPGASYKFPAFISLYNRVAQIEAQAVAVESVKLAAGSRELLRINLRAVVPGNEPLDSIHWVDDRGETIKMQFVTMPLMTERTTKELAEAPATSPPVDLMTSAMVRVVPPLPNAHRTHQVRYRATLTEGDASTAFPQSACQAVSRLADGAAEIVVTAVRPTTPLPSGFVGSIPVLGDCASNRHVQSDDPTIVQLAAVAAGNETDVWKTATKLEAFVHEYLRQVKFSELFATAAETARSRTGDCSEYAVLLCAMLRAREIPARSAIGLVYVEGADAFGYHMWVEAYIGDRWIPLDATVGRGGTSAAYLKIADTNLEAVDSMAATLPVGRLLGRLKIEVLEAK